MIEEERVKISPMPFVVILIFCMVLVTGCIDSDNKTLDEEVGFIRLNETLTEQIMSVNIEIGCGKISPLS